VQKRQNWYYPPHCVGSTEFELLWGQLQVSLHAWSRTRPNLSVDQSLGLWAAGGIQAYGAPCNSP
jgi:hypothetical protein